MIPPAHLPLLGRDLNMNESNFSPGSVRRSDGSHRQMFIVSRFQPPLSGGTTIFIFYKNKERGDQYRTFFIEHPGFKPSSLRIGLLEAAACISGTETLSPFNMWRDFKQRNSPCFQPIFQTNGPGPGENPLVGRLIMRTPARFAPALANRFVSH